MLDAGDVAVPSPAGGLGKGGPSRRRRASRLVTFFALLLVVAGATSAGVLIAARHAVDTVGRVPSVGDALSGDDANVENFLLVGSDTRATSDPNSPDYGGIGSASDVTGSRSDTIMILRRDRSTGAAALLSIPRDLWVTIAGSGKQERINSAFSQGPDVLIRTIRAELDIPIHHYVEVDFSGFKHLVEAVGGVTVCFDLPTRDTNTGLNITEPGCHLLDGVQALAYARSRHYEELKDGKWLEDPSSDLGRTKRQRAFVDAAMRTALHTIASDPFAAGRVLRSSGSSVSVDEGLDLLAAASSLRKAVDDGLTTYALPVRGTTIKGKAVLLLATGADQVLAFFQGRGPAPTGT